jgi:riboflavin-specific deaminase-like protein
MNTDCSGRPFILVNMSMTADGKIATANREISSFGSKHDRANLLDLRATVDAVMAGARTVDSVDVNLGPGGEKYRRKRLSRRLSEYNLRIIVSGSGTVDPTAHIFSESFSPIIVLATHRASRAALTRLRTVAQDVKICGKTRIDFQSALVWLRQTWNVGRLLCEGGGELNDALLREGLVDELHLTICPKIFGGRDAPTIADGQGAGCLEGAQNFHLISSRRKGDELFLVYRPESSEKN